MGDFDFVSVQDGHEREESDDYEQLHVAVVACGSLRERRLQH